ncbi:hypothetical protein IFM89_003506 [Coptis chinensis]|uniref:LTI65/LTI78 PGEED repeat domain-containing protein n=1 Tax=Coptis chinensis TaxID=261450 RepID=A0A835LLD2_9MAGN|nr:hypothetical protein IFM89_003506 [Coptis chinensis]
MDQEQKHIAPPSYETATKVEGEHQDHKLLDSLDKKEEEKPHDEMCVPEFVETHIAKVEENKEEEESKPGFMETLPPSTNSSGPEPIVTTESVKEPTTQQSIYMEKISSAAVSAKNMAASKLGYGGDPRFTSSTGIGVDTNMGTGSQVDTGRGVGETDKGVALVKGYIVEKLKPGEEDKALSEIISSAFHKPKVVVDNDEKKAMG